MTYIKTTKTSIDDRHCRGETTHRQNKLWQFITNNMISKGNCNPEIEEGQIIHWPEEGQ
jgi:hypothetical protein